jgi:hypothetical protein
MGFRYLIFRSFFEFKRRTGILRLMFPTHPKKINFLTQIEWSKTAKPFYFNDKSKYPLSAASSELVRMQAEKIKTGFFTFFSGTEFKLGTNYDWITNPDNGYKYLSNLHWSDIDDYSNTSGDIKYVWEKSRFSYLYLLVRDELHNGTENSDFIFNEIESWIDNNPVNCGPNWKCSQEISLRVINWIFALYFYKDKNQPSELQWQKILNSIYWQIDHVYKNINYSRIAVRNNHAITETFALYYVGLLFPWFDQSNKWKSRGRKWLEKELLYQIYEDGTFLQFSMNYHRVLIQLLSKAILIAELNEDSFSKKVTKRAYCALNFLYQCQDEITGHLPNYGANDGALFFPLNVCEFRDYRPQINVLHKIMTGKPAYNFSGEWSEDDFWLTQNLKHNLGFEPLKKTKGISQFAVGGYYIFRDKNKFTFIRCGTHYNRPSQADNLHIDIWCDGYNCLVDAGSYKYNTNSETLKYFMGSASHNTIMIGSYDQMLKGSRFIWYYWTRSNSVSIAEDDNFYYFRGEISAFRYLSKKIVVIRGVKIHKNQNNWLINDRVLNYSGNDKLNQNWHLNNFDGVHVDIIPTKKTNYNTSNRIGYYSSIYGIKIPNNHLVITSVDNEIETEIIISKSS